MNKIFTLLVFTFSIIQLSKADSEFFIKINNTGNYTVYLNNEAQKTKKGIVRFFDLNPGYYSLRIVSQNYWMPQTIFQDNIQIQNGFRYAAEFQKNYGLNMIAQIPYVQNNWFIDNLITSNFPNHNHYPNNNYPNYNYPGNFGWNQMDNATFESLIQTVKNTSFDADRVEIIKNAVKANNISSAQVMELLKQVSFEDNRLELAKYCYSQTYDKQNYFQVNNVFSFSSSISALNKYIAQQ